MVTPQTIQNKTCSGWFLLWQTCTYEFGKSICYQEWILTHTNPKKFENEIAKHDGRSQDATDMLANKSDIITKSHLDLGKLGPWLETLEIIIAEVFKEVKIHLSQWYAITCEYFYCILLVNKLVSKW